MLKKTIFLASTVATLSCFAYGTSRNSSTAEFSGDPDFYCGGFTLGLTMNQESGRLEDFLTFGYFNDCFVANFGVNYKHFHLTFFDHKKNLVSFLGQLGLRNRLHNNLFISYGVSGTAEHKKDPKLGYSVGAFIGLDLQITRHFLLSGKIDPFCFTHDQYGNKLYQAFGTGSLHLAYVF